MIFCLVLEREIVISKYHQPITNRIRKEIAKGNRDFEEVKISDVEFSTVFNNDIEKLRGCLKFRSKKKVERCFIP